MRSVIIFSLFISTSLQAIDNAHFYRANYFWGEPRLDTNLLSSIDVSLGGGRTRCGRNCLGDKVPLLDIYGTHNIHLLGAGIDKDLTNPLDKILQSLEDGVGNERLSFLGKFAINEAIFNWYQNFKKGFFFQFNFPVRSMKISRIRYVDLTEENSNSWQDFLRNFDDIMERYSLYTGPWEKSGVGDMSFLLGWANDYQETEYLDFVDTSIKIGVTVPSGNKKCEACAFSLPLGYDGFTGIPFKFDFSIGAWEWLTLGAHIGAIFFVEDCRTIRMKTDVNQSGLIKLVKGKAKIDMGSMFDASIYANADHFIRGLSILLGFSFDYKQNDCVYPIDKFSFSTVNSDQIFQGWTMYVFHMLFEYDFAEDDSEYSPRFSFFYNKPMAGKRIFDTQMTGIGLGLDWCF